MRDRRKIVTAGRLWIGMQYHAVYNSGQDRTRAARSQITTPARESINARLSWQKLLLLLAANFGPGDVVATLTYRDEALPKRRDEAERNVKAFIRRLRRRSPDRVKYIKVLEGYHSKGRYHHHIVLNREAASPELLRELWAKHGDNVDIELVGQRGYETWARYLSKEPRELGRQQIGDRTWQCSAGLAKPHTSYKYVAEGAPLAPPPGSAIVDRTECSNAYGHYITITAWMPQI